MVVVYNGEDRDLPLPPDDTNLADCVIVVPHNNGLLFNGSWPGFSNATPADNPYLRDGSGNTVHNFTVAPGTSLHPNAGQSAAYHSNGTAGIADPALWDNHPASIATPGSGNDSQNGLWLAELCASGQEPDLVTGKSGPVTATAGATIQYTIMLSNIGSGSAPEVVLTDTLPAGLSYVTDNSGLPLVQPLPGLLVWQVGLVPTPGSISFELTASIASNVSGTVTNLIEVSTSVTETNTTNNGAQAATTVVMGGIGPQVLIEAVLYDGYEIGELDEAVRLMNAGNGSAHVGGWQLSDGDSVAIIPAGTTILPGEAIWLSASSSAFSAQFGFQPTFEATDSDPAVPNLAGIWPGFSNSGDEVIVMDSVGRLIDALVYEDGNINQSGWSGPAVEPYTVSGVFGAEGQVLYRKRNQSDGRPVTDTNSSPGLGPTPSRCCQRPQSSLSRLGSGTVLLPAIFFQPAWLKVGIAPDNAFETIAAEIAGAQRNLQVAVYTFDNLGVAEALLAAANRGVDVTVLLEGEPAGGLADQERYVCQILEAAGGQCWFMISDATQNVYDRYRYFHAKYVLARRSTGCLSAARISAPAACHMMTNWMAPGAVGAKCSIPMRQAL